MIAKEEKQMALTIRLSDEEKSILDELFPEIRTASGKIKQLISMQRDQENELAALKHNLQQKSGELKQIRSTLDRFKNAWNIMESISKYEEPPLGLSWDETGSTPPEHY